MSALEPWSRRRFLSVTSATAIGVGGFVAGCTTDGASPVLRCSA
jgi:hypothetical protein